MPSDEFRFKQFSIRQDRCAMKVSTDGVVLGAWLNVEKAARILDIGTGTGLLALMAAQRAPDARVDALEIDQAASEQATENVRASPWASRVHVHWMDARRAHASEPYDLIVCNPPYYGGEMVAPDARRALAKHGAELSFGELMRIVDSMLASDGRFAVIVPADREQLLLEESAPVGLQVLRRGPLQYLEKRPYKRVMLELWRGAASDAHEPVTVEHVPGTYTDGYRALLTPFMRWFP